MNDPSQPSNRSSPRLVYLCGLSNVLKRDFYRFFRESIDDCELQVFDLMEGVQAAMHKNPVFLFMHIESLNQLASISSHIAFLRHEMPHIRRILICDYISGSEQTLDEINIDGILMVDARRSDLIACINKVGRGQRYIAPAFRRAHSKLQPLPDSITSKEEEILRYVSAGMQNKQIAERVHSSRHTVKNHKSKLIEKLGLSGTAELFKFAIQHYENAVLEV